MTLVALPSPILYPPFLDGTGTMNSSNTTLNAAGEYGALVFRAPKTGTISHVGFFCNAASGSPAVDARLETVAADGMPSGTLQATNTNGSQSPTANTFHWVALTAGASVTIGDLLCIKILYSSGTSLQVSTWSSMWATGLPYSVLNTGTPTKSAAPLIAGVKYNDGSIGFTGVPLIGSSTSFNSGTVHTGTTPDEIGIKFTVPFKCTAAGIAARFSGAGASFAFKLYNDSDTVLASVTGVDGDIVIADNAGRFARFSAGVTLTAGSTYRATLLPEDATGGALHRATLPGADERASWPAGTGASETVRTDAGAWTDTTTRLPMIAVVISEIDDGASAGGGASPVGLGSPVVRAA